MKLISWNANGLRSLIKKGFPDFLKKEKPDVLCLQEIRCEAKDVTLEADGYTAYWNPAERLGYAGTMTLTKVRPLSVQNGLGAGKHDPEGRVLTLEFDDFYAVNVYVPNSKRDLSRLAYREKEWDVDFLKFLKKLESKKPVIFCGDMNVAHKEIDLTYPKANEKNHGFTPEERKGFENLTRAGFLDTFREFHKEGGHYSWWSPMGRCREKNIGWRIDYFCVSPGLKARLKDAFILKDVMGSDHCPVGIVIE